MTGDVFVLHSVPDDWLLLTQNWIGEQVRHCGLRSAVIADRLLPGSPPVEHLHIRDRDQPPWLTRVERLASERFDVPLPLFRRRIARSYASEPAVVFSHFGYQGYRDLSLVKHRHITRFYGWDLHSFPNRFPRWRQRYQELFDRCDVFLVEGAFMQRTLNQQLGCPLDKIRVHHLGTDLTGVPWQPRVRSSNEVRILLAGAFREKKGCVQALEGIGLAHRDGGCAVRVEVVGGAGGWPGSEAYHARMLDVIRRFGMEDRVTFHGFVDKSEMQRIALACDLGIFASVTADDGDCEGGYPITLLDVMATGLPVIGSRHCDIPEVVNEDNGILCGERDSEGIAHAVLTFAADQTRLGHASRAARSKAEEFAWDRLGPELRDIVVALA